MNMDMLCIWIWIGCMDRLWIGYVYGYVMYEYVMYMNRLCIGYVYGYVMYSDRL